MGSAKVELVRSLYAAWERGDYSSVEWAHPEIEFVFADGPTPGSWGLAGIAEGWRDFLSAWDEWRTEVDEYRELDGERVLVLTHFTGRGKTSGLELREVRARGATVFHVGGGKVTKLFVYLDRDRALADLGLPPETGATPRGRVELARQVLDAIGRRDLSLLIELTDPEVEWQSFFALGEKGDVYRGHDGLQQYVSDLYDAWEIVRPEADEALEVGDVAVVIGRVHYRGKASGVETASPSGWLFKFRDEKVLLFRAFGEPERTLEALGLGE